MKVFQVFWRWYREHLFFNTALAACLFTLQLVHLYWLTASVAAFRLFGHSYFDVSGIWEILVLLVDYTEIPAIVTTSLVYLHDVSQGRVKRGLLYLFFINSQWLHIFWITDEFVLTYLGVGGVGISGVLAWIALGIDYLEIPVIIDTLARLPKLLKEKLSVH